MANKLDLTTYSVLSHFYIYFLKLCQTYFLLLAHNLNYIPEHDQTRSNSSTLNRMKLKKSDMVTKDLLATFGPIDSMPKSGFNQSSMPPMPYHARSSTVNPVTRQGSAFTSMYSATDTRYGFYLKMNYLKSCGLKVPTLI